MGLLLKHREKDNKWRAWATISDGWLTYWLTENEMKQYLVERADERHKLEAIEIMMGFPNGYANKDGLHINIFKGPIIDYYEWHGKVLKDYDTYSEKIDAKYLELIESLKSVSKSKTAP